jgi:hypothetical protein
VKKSDKDSIGTFGLGALTMYHFTDVISILSGDKILFLDIHQKWLPDHKNSMMGNFIEKNLLEKYPDQFEPYLKHKVLGCNMKEYFHGTIFRLPLR